MFVLLLINRLLDPKQGGGRKSRHWICQIPPKPFGAKKMAIIKCDWTFWCLWKFLKIRRPIKNQIQQNTDAKTTHIRFKLQEKQWTESKFSYQVAHIF